MEEFADNFRTLYLENIRGAFAKNYSMFSATLLKIIKTLDIDKKQGLISTYSQLAKSDVCEIFYRIQKNRDIKVTIVCVCGN